MEWMILPLKRYADFSGRSRRMEYWMFTLFLFIVVLALEIVGGIVGASTMSVDPATGRMVPSSGIFGLFGLFGLFILAILIPSLAVQVRRFHDQDKSGWMVLLGFIPFIGGLILLVFMCLPGTPGPNRFGPDPLDPAGTEHLGDVFN